MSLGAGLLKGQIYRAISPPKGGGKLPPGRPLVACFATGGRRFLTSVLRLCKKISGIHLARLWVRGDVFDGVITKIKNFPGRCVVGLLTSAYGVALVIVFVSAEPFLILAKFRCRRGAPHSTVPWEDMSGPTLRVEFIF